MKTKKFEVTVQVQFSFDSPIKTIKKIVEIKEDPIYDILSSRPGFENYTYKNTAFAKATKYYFSHYYRQIKPVSIIEI